MRFVLIVTQFGSLFVLMALPACGSAAWSQHDASLYSVMKDPTPATVQYHADLLEQMIDQATKAQVRPPAGVCAEYAYYLAKLGRKAEAKQYLTMEAQHYPEAKTFLTAFERFLQGVAPIAGDSTEPTK